MKSWRQNSALIGVMSSVCACACVCVAVCALVHECGSQRMISMPSSITLYLRILCLAAWFGYFCFILGFVVIVDIVVCLK